MKRRNKQQGFTLVEAVIFSFALCLVLILGGLATVIGIGIYHLM